MANEMLRGIVTAIVVAIVGLYVLDKLAVALGAVPPERDGEEYVNARGVIASATAIAKDAAAKLSHEQEG